MAINCGQPIFKLHDLCLVLKCDVNKFHREIKGKIITDYRSELRCNNPDIGFCQDDGNIIFRCKNIKFCCKIDIKLNDYA